MGVTHSLCTLWYFYYLFRAQPSGLGSGLGILRSWHRVGTRANRLCCYPAVMTNSPQIVSPHFHGHSVQQAVLTVKGSHPSPTAASPRPVFPPPCPLPATHGGRDKLCQEDKLLLCGKAVGRLPLGLRTERFGGRGETLSPESRPGPGTCGYSIIKCMGACPVLLDRRPAHQTKQKDKMSLKPRKLELNCPACPLLQEVTTINSGNLLFLFLRFI